MSGDLSVMESLSPTSPCLKCVGTSGLGFIHRAVVELVIPEAAPELDLKSELGLQGAIVEVDVAAGSMESSPVSCSSSPRSAKTELITRGGVGGA